MDYKKCTCDHCGTIFIVKYCSRIMKVGREIKRHFFVCPRCNTEYTSYYTNAYIRQQQSEIRKLFAVLRSARSEKLLEMYKKKIKEAQMDCQKDMDQLRQEMEAP